VSQDTSAGATGRAPAVLARGLSKHYGPVTALDGLDLEVPAGQFVLLLGPNGAGKSTLLRLLAMLLRPTSGTLRLHGADPSPSGAVSLRARIGLLSHHTLLYDHLTGRENLLFYARLYGLPDPRAAAAAGLETSGLAGRGEDHVGTYSRGMQQRLAIARALLHGPDLLLLDEPFTGLDRQSADRLHAILEGARDGRRTCLLATHDLAAGARLADRVVVLLDGRVAADRPAAGLDAAALEGLYRRAAGAEPEAAGAP
jgi:heme exporter protein A